jgi:hypothetical protein
MPKPGNAGGALHPCEETLGKMGRPPIGAVAMTSTERVRRMRRLDRLRDESRAAMSIDAPGVRTRKLQQSTDSWARWIAANSGGKLDTTAFLARAMARLEQISEDRAVALMRELVRQL